MDKAIELLRAICMWIWTGGANGGNGCLAVWHDTEPSGPVRCSRTGEHGAQDHHAFVNGENGEAIRWPNIAPGDRAKTTARIDFLLPALTDDALHAALLVVEAAPKRALDRASLDDAQRHREKHPAVDLDTERAQGAERPAELTDAEVLEACAQGGAHSPMCPVRAGHVVGRKLPMPDVMLNLDPVEDVHPSEKAEVERMRRGMALSRLWLTANKLRFASDIEEIERRANECAKDHEIVRAVASSPETINGCAQADREALERAGDVLARVHEHDRADALRAGLQAAGAVLAEGWKRGEYGEALAARAQEARDAAVLRVGERFQRARERAIDQAPALMPGEPADENEARRAVKSHSGVAERFDVTPWTREVRS